MKKIIVAANWKLNKSPSEAREFFQPFLDGLTKSTSVNSRLGRSLDIVFFPSAISLETSSQILKNTSMKWGAQNIYSESQGAFTGENSAKVVRDLGGQYALIGHSERRQYFSETNSILNKKILHTLQTELTPMYCIGETLDEREKGETESVLLSQLSEGLKAVDPANAKTLVIAYEPVWAIGTGKVATPDQVKDTHAFVQKTLLGMGFSTTPIVYGG